MATTMANYGKVLPAWLAVLVLSMAMAGCGPNVGYVVKPVPLNEEMEETVVASDGGLFVTGRVAIVDVDGLIMNQREGGLFGSGENPVSAFIEKIDKAQADSRVKALVLRINSPGGGVTASDIMYRRVMQFKADRKVPVVAVIEDVGASGGYYLACSADAIIAHPTSITGSIGVIVQTVSFAGTMSKIGIDAKAITSGKFKDMGSPLKPLDANDAALIQTIVNEFYSRFVDVVAAGRPKLTKDKVKELADGRVYTAQQAFDNGLVDSIGYMDDGIVLAKKLSGANRVKAVMYHRPVGNKSNVYSQASGTVPQMNLININAPGLSNLSQPAFLYLWAGQGQ
jgi:protease-4